MAEGSLLAGLALANARLGVVHGLAHPIGGAFGLPHGLVCAILLPTVLEFNRPTLQEQGDKYDRMAAILGDDPVEWSHKILQTLGLQRSR